MDPSKLVNSLIPPSDEAGVVRWRWAMAGTMFALLLWVSWAMGMFTYLGATGLARADELNKVEGRLASIEANQRVALRITLSGEICRLYWLRMGATGEAWVQFNNGFEQRQEEYAAVNGGARYPAAECSRPTQ
jgi:hypothetical protein